MPNLGGKVAYDHLIEGITFREESDEQTGFKEKVIIESRDKTKNPAIKIMGPQNEELKLYNLPVGAHLVIETDRMAEAGEVLAKIPQGCGQVG